MIYVFIGTLIAALSSMIVIVCGWFDVIDMDVETFIKLYFILTISLELAAAIVLFKGVLGIPLFYESEIYDIVNLTTDGGTTVVKQTCSGLAVCSNCKAYYSQPEAFDKALDEGCKRADVYRAVLKCSCGEKHLIGGENQVYGGTVGIMMFGGQYIEEQWPDGLDEFDSVMLTRCDSSDPECCAVTYHNFMCGEEQYGITLALKPGTPKYIYRNFAITCKKNDRYGIRWSITGVLDEMSGVLEWCTSHQDAILRLDDVKRYSDDVHIEPDLFPLNKMGVMLGDTFLIRTSKTDYMVAKIRSILAKDSGGFSYKAEPSFFYHHYENPSPYYGHHIVNLESENVTFYRLPG
jgi:hypothetical protein